jgi:hypothetical protein
MNDTTPRKSDDELFELAQEEYQRASRRVDDGTLHGVALAAAVRRLRSLAGIIQDPALSAVVREDSEELRRAPEAAGANATAPPPSDLLRHAQGVVAWAWEDIPDIGVRRLRVQKALTRLRALPPPDAPGEHRALAELEAQLVRLAAALGEE